MATRGSGDTGEWRHGGVATRVLVIPWDLMGLVVRVSCACEWDVTDIELCGAAFHSHWILRVVEWFSSFVNDLSVRWI